MLIIVDYFSGWEVVCDITKKGFCFLNMNILELSWLLDQFVFFSDRGNYQNQISEMKKNETTSVKPHGLGWWMVDCCAQRHLVRYLCPSHSQSINDMLLRLCFVLRSCRFHIMVILDGFRCICPICFTLLYFLLGLL